MSIEKEIKKQREHLGLSQTQLAQLSGLSLASIQNVEAGRANLSISNLASLIQVLGFDLKLERRILNWNQLIGYGLPVLSSRQKEINWVPRVEWLESLLVSACAEAMGSEISSEHKHLREREALQALVLALRDHYPSFYLEKLSRYKVIKTMASLPLDPKVIKLRRLAIERLSHYL